MAVKHRSGKNVYIPNLTVTNDLAPTFDVQTIDIEGGVLLTSGKLLDMNGEADALVLDADTDTTISAPTDDQIDFELKSVDHVVMKAAAVADSAATTNIVEIAFTSPVDTTGTNTHNALNIDVEIGNASGGTNAVNAIAIDNITADAQVVATGVLVGTGYDVGIDMQGTKIDLDAAGTTSITADTNNQIDIEINGADDFRFTANTFTALSGSTIAANTIAETTAASGVTIDGVLLKDGGAVFADAAAIEVDTVNEATSAAGVTVDGVLIKDGWAHAARRSQELTATGAITINSGVVLLNHATVIIAATLDAPAVGDELFIINNSASGTVAHTVTLSGVTFNGTNAVATLDAPGEALHLIAISATRWFVLENIGSVAFSG
jgi:hypothetical protein